MSSARVTVKGHVTGEIAEGLTILLGVGRDDTSAVAASMAAKIANLRIFEDDQGKMNRSLLEVKAARWLSRSSRFTVRRAVNAGRALLLRHRWNRRRSSTKSSARRFAGWELPWRQEFSRQ